MGWRYQPIWTVEKGERHYGVIEIYLDKKDRLTKWEATPHGNAGKGETAEELRNDLGLMLMETMCWKPVAFDKLKVGMAFTLIASPQVRELLKAALLGKSGAKRKG